MINETQKVARLFMAFKNWDLVNEKVIQENLLQNGPHPSNVSFRRFGNA